MATFYKNGRIVDLKKGEIFVGVIGVGDDRKIFHVGQMPKGHNDCEIVDLNGSFVMPGFVNAFYDLQGMARRNFLGEDSDLSSEKKKLFKNLFRKKNDMAGVTTLAGVEGEQEDKMLVENIEDLEEKDLSALSMEMAKKTGVSYIRFGQDLESLGSIDKKFGKSAVHVLEDFGFLDRKPVIVGANCLEKDDLEVLANYGCSVVILPNEDGRIGRRQTNVLSLQAKGLDVSIGSGTSAEVDFFSYMRLMISSMRSMFEDEGVMSELDALRIATNDAVLGEKSISAGLQVGDLADFVVVSGRESFYDDPFKTIVWERSKHDVLMTVKAGEVVYKNDKFF